MISFIETPRFPTSISYDSTGGPAFKTFIFSGHSGREGAERVWSTTRNRYEIVEDLLDKADFDVIRALFYNVHGRTIGFRFKDHTDFEAVDEPIGTGDGTTRVFNLTKAYGSGPHVYNRRIFKPVAGTVVTKVNGVITASTVDTTTGVVTFSVPNTPGVGLPVTATFEFDIPVRFDTDELNASYTGFQLQSWSSIPLVELKLED